VEGFVNPNLFFSYMPREEKEKPKMKNDHSPDVLKKGEENPVSLPQITYRTRGRGGPQVGAQV